MARSSRWTNIFLTVIVSLFWFGTQSFGINQDDWVDPDDIMNYDRVSKTMINRGDRRSSSNQWVDPSQPECALTCCAVERIEITGFRKKLTQCEEALVILESQQTCPEMVKVSATLPNTQSNPVKAIETVYMKRFINILLRVSGLTGVVMKSQQDDIVKNLLVTVNVKQLVVLQRFGEDEKLTLEDLDEVLIDVLQSTESGFQLPIPVEWTENIKDFFTTDEIFLRLTPWAIVLVPILMMLFRRRYLEIFLAFFCLVMLFGYLWKYSYLVKMAELDQILETQLPAPPECRPDLMTWTQSFFHAIAGDPEKCRRYHAAHHLPAALEISPTLVLAHVFSDLIATPMAALGKGFGMFAKGIMASFSLFMGPIVLTLVLLLFATFALASFALVGGGSVGNWLFSVTGWRQLPQLPQRRRASAVQAISDLPAGANSTALNAPNVMHHFHHAVRDISGGDVRQLVTPTLEQEETLRLIGERIVEAQMPQLRLQARPGTPCKDARVSGGRHRSTEREIFDTSNDDRRKSKNLFENQEELDSSRSRAEKIRRKTQDGSGDGVDNEVGLESKSVPRADASSVKKLNAKRFSIENLKATSHQEAEIRQEILSLLDDALKLNVSESDVENVPTKSCSTGHSSQNLLLLQELRTRVIEKTRDAVSEDGTSRSIDRSPTIAQVRQFVEEVRLDLTSSPMDAAGDRKRDFLSRVMDVLSDESFSLNSEGDNSEMLDSEFMTSIQKILSDEEDASEDGE